MKKELTRIVLSLAFIGTTLVAAGVPSYETNVKSLVGIEGGYSSLDYNKNSQVIQSVSLSNLGLKLGAETKDFRVFLSGRYFYDSTAEYEYLTTYGGEIQYKFNPSKAFNFFIGVNGGFASMRFDPAADNFGPRSVSGPYFGGDLGANIHLGREMDLELGGRVMSIQATHTSATYGDYNIGNIVSVYASLIFKWTMD
ncbi:hypothetical protein JHD47_02875 [Sulfurimonas sp. SAG-AH-194-L11]|nr:hypothetical protein [Sulfurimonas sp. SAG-AH-194-L11]MDF1876755.1 hypothetical protein [Sulfurimonas sp. SAG-AH-194-L11]